MRAAVYLRQSLDRLGDGLAIDRQREDCERIVRERGWTLVETYSDNSVSASKREVSRPGYDRMVREFAAGQFEALVCWDLDRLTRQPRQLEDWIDAATERGLLLTTANGEADLSTDGGRTFARIKAAVARGEIERKGTRHRLANQQAAKAGKPYGGGPVPFGFRDVVTRDDRGRVVGRTRELEAAQADAIRQAYRTVLRGGSVSGIAEQWNRAGLTSGKTCTGRQAGQVSQWSGKTVRVLLGKARNAALREHAGQVVGPARWPAIVDEDTYRAALAELDGRQTREDRPRNAQHLLSGIARCGQCGGVINAGTSYRGRHSYRCRETLGHVGRRGDDADHFVAAVMVERLARPDAVDILEQPDSGPDVAELRDQARALRARLDSLATEFADGELSASQLRTATARIRERLADTEARLAEAGRANVAAPLVGAHNVADAWEALTVDQQRMVIDSLATVTLHPVGQGARKFDPETVEVEWRRR